MISGECIKIIGLDVDCFETNIIVEKNVSNDVSDACRKIKELSIKYPRAIWVTTLCSYQIKK